MEALDALRAFFRTDPEVAAVFLYGAYDTDRSWPDTDIEIALLFPDRMEEEAIGEYMDGLSDRAPLGSHPGILMPFALNTHILPVVYEILQGGTVLVDNDPQAREAFARQARERVAEERASMLEDAKEAIMEARHLGLGLGSAEGYVLPQPPRYLDPLRVGWRLARILASLPVLEQATRGTDGRREPEQMGQIIGWYSNAVGAATGIAKASLNLLGIARPARRWEVFVPLADANLITMELAMHLAAAVELRWSLLTGGLVSQERVLVGVRASLAVVMSFARLAAWYSEVPGVRTDHRVH